MNNLNRCTSYTTQQSTIGKISVSCQLYSSSHCWSSVTIAVVLHIYNKYTIAGVSRNKQDDNMIKYEQSKSMHKLWDNTTINHRANFRVVPIVFFVALLIECYHRRCIHIYNKYTIAGVSRLFVFVLVVCMLLFIFWYLLLSNLTTKFKQIPTPIPPPATITTKRCKNTSDIIKQYTTNRT